MKTSQYFFVFLALISLNACVTTRAQLKHQQDAEAESNEEESGNSVKSEPISSATHKVASSANAGSYGLEEIKSDQAKLIGRIDELEHHESQKNDEMKKLAARIDVLEQKLAAPVATPTPEVRDYFLLGKEAYSAGRYSDATQAFEEFLKNPSAKNQEEAVFLSAEANFKLKSYKKAIIEYSKFPEKFSKSSYHAQALLKIAESFEGLGLKEDAKPFYSDLIEKFPKSAEAKAAKKRLHKK